MLLSRLRAEMEVGLLEPLNLHMMGVLENASVIALHLL